GTYLHAVADDRCAPAVGPPPNGHMRAHQHVATDAGRGVNDDAQAAVGELGARADLDRGADVGAVEELDQLAKHAGDERNPHPVEPVRSPVEIKRIEHRGTLRRWFRNGGTAASASNVGSPPRPGKAPVRVPSEGSNRPRPARGATKREPLPPAC